MKNIYLLCLLGLFSLCAFAQYNEPYRSFYHFAPKNGWIGDPCGLVYYQGQYHLLWWGKAVTKDFIKYQEQAAKAMTGDDGSFAYYTGSVVVDKNNTASFGKDKMIAVYTMANKKTGNQSQGISVSDDGVMFNYYKGNPVLDINSTEFRDPTVFWHAPTSKWVMVVSSPLERKIRFYSSNDLKQWTWMSDFGPWGSRLNIWECPDIYQLPLDGDNNNKQWVLMTSVGPNKGQYFVGDFDGTTFTLNEKQKEFHLSGDCEEKTLWVDAGSDFYAARAFKDYDGTLKNTTWMAWMNNWDYARGEVPSSRGKGFWSIPRNISLKTYPEGIRLVQEPFEALKQLREKKVKYSGTLDKGSSSIPGFDPQCNSYEIEAEFTIKGEDEVGFNLCVGGGRSLPVRYNTVTSSMFVDRTNCTSDSILRFNRTMQGNIPLEKGKLKMRIFVDKSSVEIFANSGKLVFTLLTFPGEGQTGIELYSKHGGVSSVRLSAWDLKSVWE